MPPPYNYNVSPAPTTGQGVFGRVPGQVPLPRPAGDLGNQIPHLRQLNSTLSGDLMSGLQGQLSPGTLQALQDFNSAWGVGSGMPGSGLATNRLGRNIGRFSEDLKNTAIGQYNQTVPTISHTQTVSPETQISLAEQNAVNAAAPDPTAAGGHAEQLYNRYLQSLARGPGGGSRGFSPGGGTGTGVNPSAGPSAQDSMGSIVLGWPGGNQSGTVTGGGAPPSFAGASSPGRDPFVDQFYNDWDQSNAPGAPGGAGTFGFTQNELSDLGLTADELNYF